MKGELSSIRKIGVVDLILVILILFFISLFLIFSVNYVLAVSSSLQATVEVLEKYPGLDKCEEINNSLVISVEEPDEDDEFEIPGVVKGEVEIENELGEDLDSDFEAYLYNLEQEDEEEDFDRKVNVDDGEEEDVRFALPLKRDLDEGDYLIYVKVGDEYCNYDEVEVELEKRRYNVIFDGIDLPLISKGRESILIRLANVGKEDEKGNLSLLIEDLNISGQKKFFLEEGEEKEFLFDLFFDDLEKEKYDIEFKVETEDILVKEKRELEREDVGKRIKKEVKRVIDLVTGEIRIEEKGGENVTKLNFGGIMGSAVEREEETNWFEKIIEFFAGLF